MYPSGNSIPDQKASNNLKTDRSSYNVLTSDQHLKLVLVQVDYSITTVKTI